MPPTVDFLPIAASVSANVETQGDFAGSGHQENGFQTGIAESAQLNKCWRQPSVIAAALANFIADLTGLDVLDDGNLALLIQELAMALSLASWCGTSSGTANAQILSPAITPISIQAGAAFRFLSGLTNSGATTMNVGGTGPIDIKKLSLGTLTDLSGGEIVAARGTPWFSMALISSFRAVRHRRRM